MRRITSHMRALPLVLATAIVAMGAHEASAEDRALVIGVSKYAFGTDDRFLEPQKISNLRGPEFDSDAVTTLLQSVFHLPESQIRVLKDSQATPEAIREGFEDWLIAGTEPGDRVFVYFSGHGLQTRDVDGDEASDAYNDGLDEAIATYETRPVPTGGRYEFTGIILDDQINGWLEGLAGRDVTFWVDACHSETITRGGERHGARSDLYAQSRTVGLLDQTPPTRSRGVKRNMSLDAVLAKGSENVAVWTAAAPFQLAWETTFGEDKSKPRGVFTYALQKGLEDRLADFNADGKITPAELISYIDQVSKETCDSLADCDSLAPSLEAPELYKSSRDLLATPAADQAEEPEPSSVETILSGPNAHEVAIELKTTEISRSANAGFFRIYVSAKKSGFLTVLTSRPDGSLARLFPCGNADGEIQAGQKVAMPDLAWGCGFRADTLGTARLYALVTDQPLKDFGDMLSGDSRDIVVVENPKDYTAFLIDQLTTTQLDETGDGRHRNPEWSIASLEYRVID